MEDEIRELYHDYWQACVNKDQKALRSLLSDDYDLLHMTGVKQSREEFIDALLDGTLNYYSSNQVEMKIVNNTMIGKSRVNAAVYGGGRHTWQLLETFTFRKEKGQWRFTSCHVSTF